MAPRPASRRAVLMRRARTCSFANSRSARSRKRRGPAPRSREVVDRRRRRGPDCEPAAPTLISPTFRLQVFQLVRRLASRPLPLTQKCCGVVEDCDRAVELDIGPVAAASKGDRADARRGLRPRCHMAYPRSSRSCWLATQLCFSAARTISGSGFDAAASSLDVRRTNEIRDAGAFEQRQHLLLIRGGRNNHVFLRLAQIGDERSGARRRLELRHSFGEQYLLSTDEGAAEDGVFLDTCDRWQKLVATHSDERADLRGGLGSPFSVNACAQVSAWAPLLSISVPSTSSRTADTRPMSKE